MFIGSLFVITSLLHFFITLLHCRPARLKNIDRGSAHHMVVTVGDVTVVVTDYKPKPITEATASSMDTSSLADDMSLYEHSSDTDYSD